MNPRIKEELNKEDKVKLMNPRIKEDLNKGDRANYGQGLLDIPMD